MSPASARRARRRGTGSSNCSRRRRSWSSADRAVSARRRSRPRAALGAVSRLGGKVLVLTIDPARRLATALGLDGVGNLARRVPPDLLKAAGVEPRGELWAAMLDTKQSWDELVLRHAPDEETAYRILDNRLYHNLTARFVQSHDYIAMERLYELHQSGEYDLIVIDTPPTRNAADFLEAPKRMADFFGGRLLRWLTLPYRVGGKRGSRVINVASRPFYQMADRILGSQFLEDIAEFFLNFQSMYAGFSERAKAVEQLLHDRRTTFAVVTTLEAAPLHEAEHFRDLLDAGKFHLGALVLNRTLPDSLLSADGARTRGPTSPTTRPPSRATSRRASVPTIPSSPTSPHRTRAAHGRRARSRTSRSSPSARPNCAPSSRARPEVVARVPSFDDEITDLSGLGAIGRRALRGRARDAAADRAEPHGAELEAARSRACGSRARGGRSPTSRSPTSCCSRRSPRKRVIGSSCSRRSGPRRGRRSIRPTWWARSSTRSSGRCSCARSRTGEIVENDTPAIGTKERVRVQCIPVRCDDDIVALVTRDLSMTSSRRPGELERTYQETFDRFARMISQGSFPFAREEVELETSPRVGDGVVIIDDETRVKFASPNAVSSMHRMGIHAYANGQLFREVGFDDAAPRAAIDASLPVTEELERGDVSVLLRVLPLLESGRPIGAIMMIRDVTDLRRRDRMLLSKDATIREIHHRVKNNLQTIASLLRLQARRLLRPRRGARSRSRSGASARSRSCTRRCRATRATSCTWARSCGRSCGSSRRASRRPTARSASPSRATPATFPARSRRRSRSCSTSSCRTRSTTRFPTGVRVGYSCGSRGRRTTCSSTSSTTASACRPASHSTRRSGLGLSIVHALVTGELDGVDRDARRPRHDRARASAGRDAESRALARLSMPSGRAGARHSGELTALLRRSVRHARCQDANDDR